MVKPRQHLEEILIQDESDSSDITLAKMDKELFVVDRLYFAGNISSILFAPLIDKAIGDYDLDIYSNDIYLYAFDNVVKIPNCIYIAISKSNAYKIISGKSIFQILSSITFRYYYDDDNIVFVYRVPDKYIEDYRKITMSDYTNVSKYYKALCSPTGMAFAILNNNSLLKEQWQKAEELLGEVIEVNYRNELRHEKIVRPVKIVNEQRNFPMFLFTNETYQSCALDKLDRLQ